MIKYKLFNLLPAFETNTWLLWDEPSGHALLIDPAAPSDKLKDYILANKLDLKYIVNTHGHADHIGGNEYFRTAFKAVLCIHSGDAGMLSDASLNLSAYVDVNLASPPADRILSDDDVIALGEQNIRVLHTPGHTQGCICLYSDRLLFSGDTLFLHDIGRTDLPGGNYHQIIKSVKTKLFTLPENTIVMPGHGPNSLIQDEILHNPYIKGN